MCSLKTGCQGQISREMKTLFLNPPSFQGFDGGAGSRYQAKREIRSFWYPTWLAQAAAMVEGSRVVDAPADGLSTVDVLRACKDYDLVIIYTSTPSFENDADLAAAIKQQKTNLLVGFVGPHVTVLPEESLQAAPAVDFIVRREFEYPVAKVSQKKALEDIRGLSWRHGGRIIHNEVALPVSDLDTLPFVVDVYKRDLRIENYFIGYLMHPYLSIYTGRGCPAQCTYCLWPQTITGHEYRVRSADSVYQELLVARNLFPQVKEFFLDDDTFTADPQRAVEIAKMLKSLDIPWSTSSRANLSYDTLKELKENGMRLLMVGFESGNNEILKAVRKGITTDLAQRFVKDCKSLGIQLHGTFMLGLPGETRETIEQTIRFACELDPDTIQVSIAAPYPGTEFYQQAIDNGWLAGDSLVTASGVQRCALRYPQISPEEIHSSVDSFYKRFYFRPRVMVRIGNKMLHDSEERRRRLREGKEFLGFLKQHKSEERKTENMLKKVFRDGGPGFCQFAITDACNARCGFCNFSVDSNYVQQRTYVSLREARTAINILADNGVGYIAFVGGEPTMHSDMPQMIGHAKLVGMQTLVCTNGALLSKERAKEYINSGIGSVIISIDAPDVDLHEHNRGLPGVCEKIAQANLVFHSAGVPTTASVTISRLLGDISLLPQFLQSLNFNSVTFSYPLRKLSSSFLGYSDSELIQYTDEELLAAFDEIKKLKNSFHVVNPRESLEEMQRFIRGEKQQYPCLAGFKYFYLDWNYDLYRCHAWDKPICSVFDFDSSRLVRDDCKCCMIDCYRDASVLHHLGIALNEAWRELSHLRIDKAVSLVFNDRAIKAAKSLLEDRKWIKRL